MKKILVFVFVVFSIGVLYYWRSRDVLLQFKYDLVHNNNSVNTNDEIAEILAKFPQTKYAYMDPVYLKNTQQDIAPFQAMLKKAIYLKVPQSNVHQKIVGDFRISHFLPKDDYYKQALYGKEDSLFWLIDEDLLYLVLRFQYELEVGGYDKNAFKITNGYRHPDFNKEIGGASQSRHIVGEAVDITAKDINKDGSINQEDKEIIVEIAERIVGDKGGVGLYPNTLSIHMDTRGYRARWDSF